MLPHLRILAVAALVGCSPAPAPMTPNPTIQEPNPVTSQRAPQIETATFAVG